jgi:hypothetical protein
MQEVLLWFLVAAVTGSIPASWLAGEKGRDSGAWFLAGFVIGPIAVLTVGLAPRGYKTPFKACLECQEAVMILATKCPQCGTDLISGEAEERHLEADGTGAEPNS